MRSVQDVMTRDVASIHQDATVGEAMERMRERGVTSLLVERRTAEDAYGFMSQADIISKVVARGRDAEELRVKDIMTKPIIGVPPGCTLQDCAQLMDRAGIRRVLVTRDGEVVGIVSSGDIFNVT